MIQTAPPGFCLLTLEYARMGLLDLFKRKKKGQDEPAPDAAVLESPQPEAVDEAPPVVAEEAPAASAAPAADAQPGGRSRFRTALNRTRAFFTSAFSSDPGQLVDDGYYDDVMEALVLSDVGMELSDSLIERIRAEMRDRGLAYRRDVPAVAREVLTGILTDVREPVPLVPDRLNVIMLVGVNGSGKTTISAKLAHRLKQEGLKVILAAADTFRAAATEQLSVWAHRIGVDIVTGQQGADPAAVVFDATQAAAARNMDVLIVDTAGRLQTKHNLMQELSKVTRTIDKACEGAAVTRILVLDATVGQNAMSQAELFNEACELTGIAMNKLDGSAKGGTLFAVVDRLKIPVLYIGVGEQVGDLLDFDPLEFTGGLIPDSED
ncbi:MAG: signal recognition particle-docking protein FtsY [Planctomycetales bacterium]|nr:signal recognition particle-docking protein FtsY [bacterium]UNM09955.1 MAG: signal recognition particle-docking protein FtsY [Planctomycetales bacterium]